MDKRDVIEFFDRCAPTWDKELLRNEAVISTILTLGGVTESIDLLDVACGTGVLFDDYLKRNVKALTAIDISPKMVEIARGKFPQVEVICGDVEEWRFDKQFDAVMVYNAFPHFPSPERLVKRLAELTKIGGRLSVAHGMSRERLKEHHKNAGGVSIELPEAHRLARIFEPYFDVDVIISTNEMYQVSGIRKDA